MFDWLQRLSSTSGFRWGALALSASLVLLAILLLPGDPQPGSPIAQSPPPAREAIETELPAATPLPSLPVKHQRIRAVEEAVSAATGSGRIHGAVIMPGGKTVPEEVRVFLHRYDAESALAVYDDTIVETVAPDAEGKFDFTDLPLGSYVLYATGAGHTMYATAPLTERRRELEVTLRVVPGGSASGWVLNEALEPVEGARVFVAAWDIAGQKRDAPRSRAVTSQVKTDVDGLFEVHDLRKAKAGEQGYRLAVKAEGYATYISDYVNAKTEGWEFILTAGGMVAGQLIQMTSGEPVPNKVVALDSGLEDLSATSDDGGWFFLSSVPPGSHAFRLLDEEYIVVSGSTEIVVVEGEQTADVLVQIALGGRVSGRVYDEKTGAGIGGIEVNAAPRGFSLSERPSADTASDGSYLMTGLRPGAYLVSHGRVDGYAQIMTVNAGVLITASVEGESLDVDFALNSGIRIYGRVVDENGRPLPDAAVNARTDRGNEYDFVRTGKDGTFVVAGFSPNTRVRVDASKSGYAFESIELAGEFVSVKEVDVRGVRIVMGPGGSISGIVVNESGHPQPNIQVYARAASGRGGGRVEKSGPEGAFKLGNLPEGTYTLQFFDAGGQSITATSPDGQAENVELARGEDLTGVQLLYVGETGLSISGRVTDVQGNPIPSVRIRVRGPSVQEAQTDAQGRYTFSGLGEAVYSVRASSSDHSYAGSISAQGGSENVDFVLSALASIEGRVVEAATGEPVMAFRVQSGRESHTVQDSEGRFRLTRVSEGSAVVRVQAEGYTEISQEVHNIVGGQTVYDVVVRMEAGAKLSGTVVSRSRQPISSAEIFLGRVPNEWGSDRDVLTRTDVEGRFKLTSLPSGSVTISARHPEYASGSIDLNLSRSSENSGEIVLNQGGVVEGTVRLGGSPVADVTVSLTANPNGRVTRTDKNGAYRIAGLGEGRSNVSTSIREGGSYRNQNQTVDLFDEMTTTVNFDFAPGTSSIEGTIYLNAETPIQEQAYLSATIETGTGAVESSSTQTNGTGAYLFENLPAGSVQLRVDIPSSMGIVSSLELGEHQSLQHDIYLDEGASILCDFSGVALGSLTTMVLLLSGEVAIPEFSQAFFESIEGLMVGAGQVLNGQALLSRVEPGTYTVLAVAYDMQITQSEEDLFATALWQTVIVTVEEEEQKIVQFTF